MSRVERYKEEEKQLSEKRKVTPFGRFLSIIGTLIIVLCILTCLGLVAPRFAGIESYVVVSGSMEPEIPVGSMVYSKAVEPKTLVTGDIIVFYSTDAASAENNKGGNLIPITHRVVENNAETGEIITKGDANEKNDFRPVTYNNVLGKVVLHIPKLGYAASPFATLTGKLAIAMMILAGYLLTEVGSRLRK